jgi:hypothetical protein
MQSKPALYPTIAVVSRCRLPGLLPADLELMDIPGEHQVIQRYGNVEWLSPSASQLLYDALVLLCLVNFELRFLRGALRPCNSIKDYPEDEGYKSPDEYPIALHEQLFDRLK